MRKDELIEKLDLMKSILISASTYRNADENEYQQLRKELIENTTIKARIPLVVKSNRTTAEVFRYMQSLYDKYVERTNYIANEMNAIISYVEEYGPNSSEIMKYDKTGWEKIDDSVVLLRSSLDKILDRISINEIGVRCRETIILLAKQVYDDKIHHPKDYPNDISSTDVKRMFDGYIEYSFPGANNEGKRKYAKACNDLANYLTHSKNLTTADAKMCINATISLIQLIKIIDQDKNFKS